ncbi:MAG: glucose-6-phosphate isomerase, partial [Mucinivorans sp.]
MKLKIQNVYGVISPETIAALEGEMMSCNELLHTGKGAGNDFLGWVNLPSSISETDLTEIETAAKTLSKKAEVVVVIGIGGSYLGAKAVIDSLSNNFDWLQKERTNPVIIFAGQNLSEDYMAELMATLQGREIATIVISKSGTTTEPAIAFRVIREAIEQRYGKKEAAQRIVAITDRSRGALRTLATQQGYKTFVIEDNVGGRFSVLTPVGLLPLAVAGVDVRALVRGAVDMEKASGTHLPMASNLPMQYAAIRTALYRAGKKIEILASYEPKLHNIGEWWKQLYGESEGKGGKGIFPAGVTLTADLHSMGQYIQDGERTLFETVISVCKPDNHFNITSDEANLDGLNFLAGKAISEVNRMARLGTMLAHVDGGVANIEIELPKIDAYNIGN